MDAKTYVHFSENLMPPGMSVRSPKKKGLIIFSLPSKQRKPEKALRFTPGRL